VKHFYLTNESEFFHNAPDGYFLTGFWGHGVNSYACYLCVILDELMTLSMSLRGTFDNPNTTLNHKNTELFINTRISPILYNDVRNLAHFTRVVKPTKSLIISSIQSIPQALVNYYMPDAPLRISGNNLKFHPKKNDEGINCIQSDNSHYHIQFYSVIGNKRVDFSIPNNLGDIRLQLSTRYGNSEELHSELYENIIKVMIATAFEDTVIVCSYAGASGTASLSVEKETGNLSYQAEGDTAGSTTPILEAGTYTIVSGTVTNSIVVDIVDYEAYRSTITEIEVPTVQITL